MLTESVSYKCCHFTDENTEALGRLANIMKPERRNRKDLDVPDSQMFL